jgi:hypothetical protein
MTLRAIRHSDPVSRRWPCRVQTRVQPTDHFRRLVPKLVPQQSTKQKGQSEDWPNCLNLLVRPERFERPTPWFVGSMASISIKGEGFARHRPPFGTRFAPFRVRPPVSPLTLLPAMTRATTDNERGNETAKTRWPLVTAARWPGREAVANIRLWQVGFSWASVRPAA